MAPHSPELPSRFDALREWWLEVTGQTEDISLDPSRTRVLGRRFLLWLPVIGVVILLLGLLAFVLFTGWRAHDLARKAGENAVQGELRLALVQAQSARRLRPWSGEVIRHQARVLAACRDPRSLAVWEDLGSLEALSPADRAELMGAAVQLGDETQFARILAAVEAQDGPAGAELWRGRRALEKRDFTAAEKHFRAALAQDSGAAVRLEFARLLSTIGTQDSVAEAVQIVDSLATGPEAAHALAFGLAAVPAGPATRLAWASRAFADWRADNEALLPAATVLVADRQRTLNEIVPALRTLHTGAPTEARVAFARWLLEHQAPEEALVFARSSEAPVSREAFLVRADALTETRDWAGLLALMQAGSPLNVTATSLLRSRAERGLGRTAAADESLAAALRSAVGRFQLPESLDQVDAVGQSALGDRVLLDLCRDFACSDYALRVARHRFSGRGEPRLREQAFTHARTASPRSPAVLDYERRAQLMDGSVVDPDETAEALAAEPSNMDVRLTHALALLRQERVAEARQVLEPGEVIRHQLDPGQKAVVAAVLAAAGSREEARALARTIRPAHLTDSEYRLVYSLAASEPTTS